MVFGIQDNDFLNAKCVVLDSIAGAGKSTAVDRIYRQYGISYNRYVSTNCLKKDASDKFDMEVKTICAGLFDNENGSRFYANFKDDIKGKYLVLDEVLQTSERVFDLVEYYLDNFPDRFHFVILTDSRQTTAPGSENIINRFKEFCKRDDIIYVNVAKSLRPRNSQTENIFNELYDAAGTDKQYKLEELRTIFDVVDFDSVTYNQTDLFLCHRKSIESYLYKTWELFNDYSNELIPKGRIASRNIKDFSRYPILSQQEAEDSKTPAYLQVKNVSSVNRAQGTECEAGNNLYYFVSPDCSVASNELYTAFTRVWLSDSFKIVVVNEPRQQELKYYKGLQVKEHKYLTLNVGETQKLGRKQFDDIIRDHEKDGVFYDRKIIFDRKGSIGYIVDNAKIPATFGTNKSTLGSLLRKDASTNYTFMPAVYAVLAEKNINKIKPAIPTTKGARARYQVDMYSAYMAVLYNTNKIPCDGYISKEYNADMLNFYIYHGNVITDNSIITENLKDYIEATNGGTCEFLFATPCKKGCMLSEWLHEKAYRSQESKQQIKGMHWGYMMKPFLQYHKDDIEECYILDSTHIYEVLLASIFSDMCLYMLPLCEALNGTRVVTDAVYFEDFNDTTVDTIKSMLPDWFDWRVVDNATGLILYRTYAELPTEAEYKVAQQRRKREIEKNAKSMKEEEKKIRARERARKARELKKQADAD